jgi:tRNA(Ile)-lysidine synthase
MMRRTVRSALLRTFPEASRLDAEHVDAIVDGIDDPRFCRDLPFGLRAESEYTVIRVSSTHERTLSVAPSLLTLPGKVDLGEAGEMLAEETEPHDVAGARDSVVIDASSIGSLLVDGVRPGDRMQPLGMSGTRKLSDMLIDAKVPKRERSGTPVVRSGDRIAWLAGVRMSEEFRVGPQTKRAIRLSWRRSTSERTVRE